MLNRTSRVRRDDRGVVTFTFDSPATRNAVSLRALDDLRETLGSLDAGARALVLAATGEVFCSGADRTEMAEPDYLSRSTALLVEVLGLIADVPVPIIAQVNGPALGAGLALVAAADISVASARACFALPEVTLGLVARPAAAACARRIGQTALLDLVLTGRRMGAQEAERIGLVSAVVPAESLDGAVEERLIPIVAARPEVVAEAKLTVRGLAADTRGDVRQR